MDIFNWINDNFQVDGVECFYPLFTDEQTKFLLDYCHKFKLFISGGSDYHGKLKPTVKLGTGIDNNLIVPKDEIDKWIHKRRSK